MKPRSRSLAKKVAWAVGGLAAAWFFTISLLDVPPFDYLWDALLFSRAAAA